MNRKYEVAALHCNYNTTDQTVIVVALVKLHDEKYTAIEFVNESFDFSDAQIQQGIATGVRVHPSVTKKLFPEYITDKMPTVPFGVNTNALLSNRQNNQL